MNGGALSAYLYPRVLGPAWATLPAPLRAMHEGCAGARGEAKVERGRGLLARLAAAIVGLPAAGENVPLKVTFAARDGGELWTRDFAGKTFHSLQTQGRDAGLIDERFGPFSFGLALIVDGDKLRLVASKSRLFGVPLPRWCAPGGEAYETARDGRFCFHVEIAHRFTGPIVRYQGWLVPT